MLRAPCTLVDRLLPCSLPGAADCSAGKDRYDNINATPSSADSNIVAGNTRFLALPWNAGGGPFVVHNLANLGRLETIPHMFNGHSSNVQVRSVEADDISMGPGDYSAASCFPGLEA